jgi:hypothetical protein
MAISTRTGDEHLRASCDPDFEFVNGDQNAGVKLPSRAFAFLTARSAQLKMLSRVLCTHHGSVIAIPLSQ